MSEETRRLLKEAQDWCDDNDKSTEFMLEYMQDYANTDFDTVMSFLEEQMEES
jgi:hypothetical protein